MTSPASAEPTESDWDVALDVVQWWVYGSGSDNVSALQGNVARALASQRAEIVARYEQVADELTSYRHWHPTAPDAADMIRDAGRRICQEAGR